MTDREPPALNKKKYPGVSEEVLGVLDIIDSQLESEDTRLIRRQIIPIINSSVPMAIGEFEHRILQAVLRYRLMSFEPATNNLSPTLYQFSPDDIRALGVLTYATRKIYLDHIFRAHTDWVRVLEETRTLLGDNPLRSRFSDPSKT